MRAALAILFLSLQLGSIVYARFTPRRYFCWAPNDYVVEYELEVKVHGHSLSREQAWARYQIDRAHQTSVEHPAEHLMDAIKQYEQTYGKQDQAQVRLDWRYDGHPEVRHWQWPQ